MVSSLRAGTVFWSLLFSQETNVVPGTYQILSNKWMDR